MATQTDATTDNPLLYYPSGSSTPAVLDLVWFRYANNFPPYAGAIVGYDKTRANAFIIKSYYSPKKETREFVANEQSMLPFCPFESLISTFVMSNEKVTNERVRESQRWLADNYGPQIAADRNSVYDLSHIRKWQNQLGTVTNWVLAWIINRADEESDIMSSQSSDEIFSDDDTTCPVAKKQKVGVLPSTSSQLSTSTEVDLATFVRNTMDILPTIVDTVKQKDALPDAEIVAPEDEDDPLPTQTQKTQTLAIFEKMYADGRILSAKIKFGQTYYSIGHIINTFHDNNMRMILEGPVNAQYPPGPAIVLDAKAEETRIIEHEEIALNIPDEERLLSVRYYPCYYCPMNTDTKFGRAQALSAHLQSEIHEGHLNFMFKCPACTIPINLALGGWVAHAYRKRTNETQVSSQVPPAASQSQVPLAASQSQVPPVASQSQVPATQSQVQGCFEKLHELYLEYADEQKKNNRNISKSAWLSLLYFQGVKRWRQYILDTNRPIQFQQVALKDGRCVSLSKESAEETKLLKRLPATAYQMNVL